MIVFGVPVHPACIEQAAGCFEKWKSKGYITACALDPDSEAPGNCNHVVRLNKYRGYADAMNQLARLDCDWLVAGGHDHEPDPNHRAEDIASMCFETLCGTRGVMQPTGDGTGLDAAISPWIGRDFIRAAYGGNGPYCPEYFHFFADAELKAVAEMTNAYWPCPAVVQAHRHWTRMGEPRPAHLMLAAQRHSEDRKLFESRRLAGFPGAL